MSRSSFRHCVAALSLLFLSTLGCNRQPARPKVVKASGIVVVDGEALESGYIQFIPENDRPASAKIGPGGKFVLETFENEDGCVPGKHRVTVSSVDETDKTVRKYKAPPEYADLLTSKLEMQVDEPTDALLVRLTWGGRKPTVEKIRPEY